MKRMNMVDYMTVNRDNLSEANTSQIITGITGIASQLIANKNAGAGSPEANKVASLSEQTLAAVLAAQGIQPQPKPVTTSPNYLIFGAVAMVAIIVIIMVIVTKMKK